MGNAVTESTDFAAAEGVRQFSAFLRLRQGGAARATWRLMEVPGGTMISVGTDAACDWQIRAAFVPARAFSVLLVGGRAFVRSGPEPGLLIDGKPIDDNWNSLPEQARIDIGLARFEIVTGYADAVGGEPALEPAQSRPEARRQDARRQDDEVSPMAQTDVAQRQESRRTPRRSSRRKRTLETQEYAPVRGKRSGARAFGEPLVTPPPDERPPNKPRNSTIELDFQELDYVGTIPHARRRNEHSGEHAVAPSLLEYDEITRVLRGSRGVRYMMAGVLFAGAYGAWLYLLDHL